MAPSAPRPARPVPTRAAACPLSNPNRSAGSLSQWLTTNCDSAGPHNDTGFIYSPQCTGAALPQSLRPLGCWLRDDANWAALVAAQGNPAETRKLVLRSGAYSVKFTRGGLLCMAKWFDLTRDAPLGALTQNWDVDGTPGACPEAPPNLEKMGGNTMLMLVATNLNLLRDIVLQKGARRARVAGGAACAGVRLRGRLAGARAWAAHRGGSRPGALSPLPEPFPQTLHLCRLWEDHGH